MNVKRGLLQVKYIKLEYEVDELHELIVSRIKHILLVN